MEWARAANSAQAPLVTARRASQSPGGSSSTGMAELKSMYQELRSEQAELRARLADAKSAGEKTQRPAASWPRKSLAARRTTDETVGSRRCCH